MPAGHHGSAVRRVLARTAPAWGCSRGKTSRRLGCPIAAVVMRLVCLAGAGRGDYAVPRKMVQRTIGLDGGRGMVGRGVVRWCHEPALAVLRRKPPQKGSQEGFLTTLVRAVDRSWRRRNSDYRSSGGTVGLMSSCHAAVTDRWSHPDVIGDLATHLGDQGAFWLPCREHQTEVAFRMSASVTDIEAPAPAEAVGDSLAACGGGRAP